MADESTYRDVREHFIHEPQKKNLENNKAGARDALYERSVKDPAGFWSEIADTFHWQKKWDPSNVFSFNFHRSKGPIAIEWFKGGITNVCYNCVDRHVAEGRGETVAFYWEGNDVGEHDVVTYAALQQQVIDLAKVLRYEYGVKKGDCVSLYLPMLVAGPVAMLAVARLGATCSVVFGGFSAQALASRLIDSKSTILITADATMRGEKPIKLKAVADEALVECEAAGLRCRTVVVERLARPGVPMTEGRDAWLADLIPKVAAQPDHVEWVDAEHPLFMLYTSGSTGKPKGVVHTTGGYMVYAATTHRLVFDYHPGDVYFCTADIGWITGHTYVTFGPLLNGATSVLFEGVPVYPTPSRWWEIVDKYQVTQFYTAPTAIRSLMRSGDEAVQRTSRASLRVLGSVGEPINRAAWEWYYHVVGGSHCDICDSWWQTETGGIMITPIPGVTRLKPGSATLPFFGVQPVVLDSKDGALQTGNGVDGLLCMQHSWPGQSRTIFGDHERFEQTYFSYDGYYFSGDGCHRDDDGYYWLTGRVDDVVNVSGHRLGTSEIECAINTHPDVVESAVVGFPHDIKGEGIYAYTCFREGVALTPELLASVKATIRKVIGPIATPDVIHPAIGLPKTRSGKIMRRILRKIAVGQVDELGDISTLADPTVVEELLRLKAQWVKM